MKLLVLVAVGLIMSGQAAKNSAPSSSSSSSSLPLLSAQRRLDKKDRLLRMKKKSKSSNSKSSTPSPTTSVSPTTACVALENNRSSSKGKGSKAGRRPGRDSNSKGTMMGRNGRRDLRKKGSSNKGKSNTASPTFFCSQAPSAGPSESCLAETAATNGGQSSVTDFEWKFYDVPTPSTCENPVDITPVFLNIIHFYTQNIAIIADECYTATVSNDSLNVLGFQVGRSQDERTRFGVIDVPPGATATFEFGYDTITGNEFFEVEARDGAGVGVPFSVTFRTSDGSCVDLLPNF